MLSLCQAIRTHPRTTIIQASPTGVNISQPDVTLTLDENAVIRDAVAANAMAGEVLKAWFGRPWADTVTDGGIEKVRRSLDDARQSGVSAFQQITQRFPSGLELPIEYTTVRLGGGAGLVAIGRGLRATSELQSRLMAAQQSMERDYWKLREAETRYRLLFDASSEAVLVLRSEDLRVIESNPAAIRAFGLTRGWAFLDELAPDEHGSFRAMLARVSEGRRALGEVFHIGAEQTPWVLRASLMSDPNGAVYMLQLALAGSAEPADILAPESSVLTGLLDEIPDGFIAVDRDGIVRRANRAFLALVQVGAEAGVLGRRLDRWLRRSGPHPGALMADLQRDGAVELHAMSVEGERGTIVDVEVSAGGGADSALFGVVLRDAGQRIAAADVTENLPALPKLDDSAGRTPLRTLVQAAVSVIERHYVESALGKTAGNRTAAAELLGLSRQSLYAKLSRYGLESGSVVPS
jgi:transcriptional regulator PpsR